MKHLHYSECLKNIGKKISAKSTCVRKGKTLKYKLLFGLLLSLTSLNIKACDPFELLVCNNMLATCIAHSTANANANYAIGVSSGCCFGCVAGAVCTCMAIRCLSSNNAGIAQPPQQVIIEREVDDQDDSETLDDAAKRRDARLRSVSQGMGEVKQ